MNLYLKNPNDSTKKFVDLINTFSDVVWIKSMYKISSFSVNNRLRKKFYS
jgi:hypothetical protein